MPHGIPRQQTYLFTDFRHILCSDLKWVGPDGKAAPLHPTGAPFDPVATTAQMPRGIRLFVEKATKTDPMPTSEHWRRRITYEDGRYRAWSANCPAGAPTGTFEIRCEESRDGFDWRLARASQVRLPASGPTAIEGFTVFRDPSASAAERFKAVMCIEPPHEQFAAMFEEYKRLNSHHRIWRMHEKFIFATYGLVSPDGLDWRPLPNAGHLMVGFNDSDTSVHFDEASGKYVMYTRLMFQQRRWVGRAESEDFRQWSPVQPIIAPPLDGPMTDDVYQNGFTFYPGESAYYLMFPMIYHRRDQRSSIHLCSSEDGLAWLKVPGGALIEPGEPGTFDSEFLAILRDLVPMGTERVALPYMGTRFPHKYPRWPGVLDAVRYAYATWPRGRICGLRADQVEYGYFATFPLESAGRGLRVNARLSRGGELRVGVVGRPGRSLDDCDPIVGDGLKLPVHWRGDDAVGAVDGEAITLEFRIRSGDLFGFEWV